MAGCLARKRFFIPALKGLGNISEEESENLVRAGREGREPWETIFRARHGHCSHQITQLWLLALGQHKIGQANSQPWLGEGLTALIGELLAADNHRWGAVIAFICVHTGELTRFQRVNSKPVVTKRALVKALASGNKTVTDMEERFSGKMGGRREWEGGTRG